MAAFAKALRTSRPLRAAIVVLGVFVLLPYILVPLYRFVDPVSTLMLWRWATGQRAASCRCSRSRRRCRGP
jgi:hypothetical protein